MGKKEYLVEGAQLICIRGSQATKLLVPEGHNYDSGGKKKANCCDCIKDKNIKCFGECSKNTQSGTCEGFMELDDQWMNVSGLFKKYKKVNGNDAITMDSILICKKGGVIMPLTSGQGFDSEVDIEAFMKRYLKVMAWAIGENQFCHVFGADPVNLNTGNYVYDREDLYIKGKMPLIFKRFYNSLSNRTDSVLGERWKHNYEIKLEFSPNKELVNILLEDGRERKYRKKLDGKYESIFGGKATFAKNEDGSYTYKSGELTYYFSNAGTIIKIVSDYGVVGFSYNDQGQLEKAETDGNYLSYQYNKEGKLIRVSDNTNRSVEFYYSYGRLIKFITTMKAAYSYTYNESGVLQSVISPKGVCSVFNEYDGQNRVIKQYLPDGGIIEFGYDDNHNETYVKEQNGKVTSYVGDELFRNKKTTSEDTKEEYDFNNDSRMIYHKDKNGNETYINYDKRGNRTKVINGMGYETRMFYDDKDRMVKMMLPNGGIIENEYSVDGKLVKMNGLLENCQEISYNEQGLPNRIMDADNFVIQVEYDEKGNIICMDRAGNSRMSYRYDKLNRTVQTIDGNNNVTAYEYNDNDDIIAVVNAEGNRREYQYDECGKVTAIIDFDKTVVRREYDVCNRVSRQIHKTGAETKVKYDKVGNIIEQELPNGAKTKFKYTQSRKISEIVDSLNHRTFYEYDGNDNLVKVVNAKGEEVLFTYDACNRLISKVEADGTIIRYEYNSIGQLTKIVYPTGTVLEKEYDLAGRLIKKTDLYGNTSFYKYSKAGRLVEKTDWKEGKIHYKYDRGLLNCIQYQNGCEEHFGYDHNDNIIEWKRKNGDIIFYQYDCMNRVKTIRNKLGIIKSFEYDAMGNVVCMTDAGGNSTRYEYSPVGDIVQVINADGSGMNYEYDDIGQLISVYKLNGNNDGSINDMIKLYGYEYDVNGKVKTITDALENKEHYHYNELGQLQLKVDRDGYETQYVYGKNGYASEIVYGDGSTVRMSYTPLRQLEEMEDWLGKTQIVRNENNRLEKVIDHNGQTVSYQYGERGECNAIIYPDNSKVAYEYDDFMRLKCLSFGKENIHYMYAGDKLVGKKYSNGIESLYKYDYADRINSIIYKKDEVELEKYQYLYDRCGNKCEEIRIRSGAAEDSGRYKYEYNMLNRLTGVYHNDRRIRAYEYDGFGNRIKKWENGQETSYLYNEANQLLREISMGEVTNYRYDLRGNLTEIERNGIEEKRYEFDPMNHLRKAADRDGRQAQYSYNGQGYRVEKIMTGKETGNIRYAVNQTKGYNNCLWEEENGKISKYIWGENIACIEREGRNSFVLTNDMGTPIRSLDRLGHTEAIFASDEYGEMRQVKGNGDISVSFVGYMADDISGTLYAQVREYMPQLGRFISEDKVGGSILFSASFNKYDYCWGNPLVFVDITGLFLEWLKNLAEGREAHNAIELYAEDFVDPVAEGEIITNAFIPCGLKNTDNVEQKEKKGIKYFTKSGYGYADIIYINEFGDAEVYEIKPDTLYGKLRGPLQVAAYVFALNTDSKGNTTYEYGKALKGNSINKYFNDTVVMDPYDLNVYYELSVNEDLYPGVIFYERKEIEPKSEGVLEKILSTARVGEPEEEMKLVYAMAWAVAGYFFCKMGALMIADNVSGVGVIDDPIAIASFVLSIYCISMSLQTILSCAS